MIKLNLQYFLYVSGFVPNEIKRLSIHAKGKLTKKKIIVDLTLSM